MHLVIFDLSIIYCQINFIRRLQMLDDPRGNDTSIINDTMLIGLINSAGK